MPTINFVRQRRRKLSKLEKIDRQAFKIGLVVFGVVGLATVAVLSLRLFLLAQQKRLQAVEEQYRQQVLSQEEKEKSFVLFVAKLKSLAEIFEQRRDKQRAIAYFTQVFGPDVVVEQIAYDSQRGQLAFGLKSKDVFILERVFEILADDQTNQQFSQVTKSDLQRVSNGAYQMQVTVTLEASES